METTTGYADRSARGDTGDQSWQGEQPADGMQQTAQKVQNTAAQLSDQAKQQVATQLNNQKDRATSSLSSVAQALRQTGQQLRDQGQSPMATVAGKAADGVDRASQYLSERDIVALRSEAERLARQRPALFLAGAFTIGWLGARFFKSSTPNQDDASTNYTGAPRTYARQTYSTDARSSAVL